MAFERPEFEPFYRLLKTASGDADMEKRCIAENFILEERLTQEREDSYGEHLEVPVDEKAWGKTHKNYVDKNIIIKSGIPETFSDANKPNIIPELDKDQYLVRLENIGRLDRFLDGKVDDLINHGLAYIKDENNSNSKKIIKEFLARWNKSRDNRPAFAGFWGEVKDIFTNAAGDRIDDDNWADRLRDRFGLGHLNPELVGKIPVMLFYYRVNKIIPRHGDASAVAAIPTIVDGKRTPFFCPTPKNGWDNGQTLDLSEGGEDEYTFYREILHRAIEYKPEFLYSAGWITTAPGKTLEQARKIHLDYIMDDFENGL